MWDMNKIRILKASSPAEMQGKVDAELAHGFDLYGPLVTGHRRLLAQWVVEGYAYHEYRLVEAFNLESLESGVLSLQSEGFDFYQFTTFWNDLHLQWMCRAKERALRWVDGMTGVSVPASYNVVERVEPTLHLIPNLLAGAPPLVVEGGRVVEFPSRSQNST